MKYELSDLIDIPLVQRLTDLFYKATGIPASLVGLDGKIITISGWQEICTKFHRVNPGTRKRCVESDTIIANQLGAGQRYTVYKCRNGLIDAASPIAIDGEHIANFFTGQFLFEPPDLDLFRQQARRFGFDETAYVQAAAVIPVIDEGKVRTFLDYFSEFAGLLAQMGRARREQMETQESIHRSGALLKAVVEGTTDAVYVKDRQGRYLLFNTAAGQITGKDPQEVLGKDDTFLFPPKEARMIMDGDQALMDRGIPQTYEESLTPASGDLTTFLATKGPFFDHDGQVAGLFGIARDIGYLKRMEEERLAHLAFLENVDRVNQAVQGTNDLEQMMDDVLSATLEIFECDRAWLISPCDPAAVSWQVVMERTRPEYPGAFTLGIDVPMGAEAAWLHQIATESDGPATFGPGSEHPLPPENAKQFGYQSMIATILNPKAGGAWLFGLHQCSNPRTWTDEERRLFREVGRRLTDALKSLLMYRNLQESELRYREIFSNTSDALILLDVTGDGRFRFAGINEAAERSTGYSNAEVMGKFFEEATNENLAQAAIPNFRRCVETGMQINYEEELDLPTGRRRFHSSLVPVRNAAGSIYRLVEMAQDITDRKRAEEALYKSEERFRSIASNLPGIVIQYYMRDNGERGMYYVDERAEDVFGVSNHPLRDWHERFDACIAQEHKERWNQSIKEAMHSGAVWDCEARFIKPTGEEMHIKGLARSTRLENEVVWNGILLDVTDRVRAESALKFTQFAIDKTIDQAFWTTKDGHIFYVNEAACRTLGYSREELLSMSIPDIDPTFPPEVFAQHWRDLQEHGSATFESYHRTKDGHVYPVEIRANYVVFDGEEYNCAFATDITERKRIESIMQARLRLLEFASSASPDEFLSRTLDEIEALTGSSIGFYHFLESDQQTLSLQNWSTNTLKNMCTATGKGSHYPVAEAGVWVDCVRERRPVIHNDYASLPHRKGIPEGHAVILRELIVPIFRGSMITAIIGVGNKATDYNEDDIEIVSQLGDLSWDIAERKKVEEEVHKSRDELELRVRERTEELRRQAELLELSHEAILVKNLDNRIVFWSRGAEETYGWSKAEALGNVTHDLLKTTFPLPFEDYKAVVMEQGRWDGELIHTTKDRREIRVLSRQALQRDETGIPIGVFEINIDITAEHRLEDQLRQAHKLEAIGTLAGGIAHDFNNILAAIMGNAELALDDVDEESPVHNNLSQIMKAALRARERVKEILAFSRKSALEQKPVRMTPLVKEAFNLLRASLPSTIEMNLRATTTEDVVVADPSLLQQALMNLTTNAAQAMPEGGTLTITLFDAAFSSAHPVPDPDLRPGVYVALSVQDTGHGMDESVRRRIFEPFFTTKKVGAGTGLGLAVVYGMVKSCGGAITAESEAGRGSCFTIYLPKVKGAVEAVPKRKKTLAKGTARILFVDDEEPLRLMAEIMLSRLGYQVTTEGNPENALRRLLDNPEAFDAVITDYTMPGITGLALSKEILRVRPGIPILLCTGHNDAVDEERAKTEGIRGFLMKPLTREELADGVGGALKGSEERSDPLTGPIQSG